MSGRERDREREGRRARQREGGKESETERGSGGERDREREGRRARQREGGKESETEREGVKESETEREGGKESETERGREGERDREREGRREDVYTCIYAIVKTHKMHTRTVYTHKCMHSQLTHTSTQSHMECWWDHGAMGGGGRGSRSESRPGNTDGIPYCCPGNQWIP